MPALDAAAEPVRTSFSSRRADEVTEFIRQMYVDNHAWFPSIPARGAAFEARTSSVPGLGCSSVRSDIDYAAATEPLDAYLFLLVRRGEVRMRSGRDEVVVPRGEVSLYPLGVPLRVDLDRIDLQVLQLPAERLGRLAEDLTGEPADRLVFEATTPVSAAMRTYWRSVIALVHGAMLSQDSPMSAPLVAEELARTAAVAALHVFPNSTMHRHHLPGPGHVGPAALRRAVAFIDANAERPVTLSEVAAAAGTSSRALQYAFRRHHGTTPLAYARQVRLERAHHELQSADPTRGDTVQAIAARWGFPRADRFAAAHRSTFGVLPSQTLRS